VRREHVLQGRCHPPRRTLLAVRRRRARARAGCCVAVGRRGCF